MLEYVIKELGQRMDLDELCLDEQGMLTLHMENIGLLQLEHDAENERIFVCLSLPYPAYEHHIPRKVLEICSAKAEIPIRGGVYNDMTTILTIMDTKTIAVADLENTIVHLSTQLAKIFDK